MLSLALLDYHLAVSSQSKVSWNFHTWNTEPILFLNDKVTAKMKKLLSEIKGQVDSTEFAESAESAENHNFISSLIKQPKEYLSTYSDTFSQILSVKNNSNSSFLQFRVFVCGPIPKNEKAEFAKGFKKFKIY